jgi:hypothetical protein
MMLNPTQFSAHETAIKVATQQTRDGQMSLADAQANADWAQKQIDRSRGR